MAEGAPGLVATLVRESAGHAIRFDVSLPARGVTALFGPSGAGKTSCLRMIAGLDRAATGALRFKDQVWCDSAGRIFVPPHRRRIGYVRQEPVLFGHLDVAGNLDFAFRRAGRPAHLDRDGLVDRFGVRPLLARRVAALSGGERRRVAILRAVLADPVLLLLDEPLSALDGAARSQLLGLLERIRSELAVPMILVSHAIEEVARLADHIVLLQGGRVVAQGPLAATLTRPDLPAALIEAAGAVIEAVVIGHDEQDQLTELGFAGGVLLLPRHRARTGDTVRCRIAARDVVLACQPQQGASALNQLDCRVMAIGDADHPSQCLVQLAAGDTVLLARITRRSCRTLDLGPGSRIWAQVKAVALDA